MAVIGKSRSFFRKYAFIVEIPDVGWAGFTKAGPLDVELAVIEQWEGGAIVAEESPGRMKFADCTLERGATKDLDLWKWFKQVADAAAGTGDVDEQYKKTVVIVQRDRDGSVLRRWYLYRAWPKKFSGGDWDNTADANVMESVVLRYKYFAPNDG